MKALFIAHKPLSPVVGGDQIRMAQMLRLLRRHASVTLAYTCHHPAECPPGPDDSDSVRIVVSPLERAAQLGRMLFNGKPLEANLFHNRRLQRYVDRHADEYDIIFCANVGTAAYIPPTFKGRALLDITDSLTMNREKETRAYRGLRSLYNRLMWRRMERFERWCRSRFDAVAYISDTDRRYLADLPTDNTFVVGNAVEIPPDDRCCIHNPDAADVLFVGRMDYSPNVLAVTHFCREVWTKVREHNPRARFVIAGAHPVDEVKRLGAIEGVTVTGFVESLEPYWQRAAVVVAPMLSGSGIQNKILQALAHGCAVVTTPIGAEGLDTASGAFVTAASDTEMARAVCRLLDSPDERRTFGERGRRMVAERFSIEAIARDFDRFTK